MSKNPEKQLADDGLPPMASVWRRSFKHLGPFVLNRKSMLVVAGLALISGALIELLKPWPLKFVFDYLLEGKSFLPAWAHVGALDESIMMLIVICTMVLLVALLANVAAYFKEFLLQRIGEEVALDLRVAMFRHVQKLGLGYHDSSRLGDLITRITDDTKSVRNLATTSVLQLATAFVTLASMLGIMFWMDWRLALVAAFVLPILAPTVWYFRGRIESASRKRRKRESELTSVTQETMTSIRLVKTLGREAHQQKEFGRESGKSAELGLQVAKLEALYTRLVDLIVALGTCAVIAVGVHRVWDGSLLAGDLLVFAAYVKGMYAPIRDLAKQSSKLASGKASLERLVEVLELEPAVQDAPDAQEAPRFAGRIEFENVSFEYKPGVGTLEDVSFSAEPGQIIALVGHSGAGKSTVLSLISRLYDPDRGRILIDGHDIRELKLDSVRDQVSVVLQESVLLQTSITENIVYGRQDATMEDVEAAAQAATVSAFIDRLANGYDTIVGPRGATLSGGERQRVAIARAIVRRSPILLLDEPTTGLDAQSELLVMQALGRLMDGKTTLLVSHKINLIERADLLLVVDSGRIVERGTHQQLLRAGGVYAAMRAAADASGELADVAPALVETRSKPS